MIAPGKHPSHAREMYYILIITAVLAAGYMSVWGPGGYKELKKAQADLEAQRERVEALQRGNQERLDTIKALRSDREALEKYARGKGYGRKEEIIQQLPQPNPAPPKP